MSIPPDLSQRLHKTLLRCDSFDSNGALAAVFVDARISQWAADLPEASSKGERVRAILKYLADKRNTRGENALVLFLDVLYEPLAPTDALRQGLVVLAAELEQYMPTPDTPQWDAVLDRYREWVKDNYGTMRVLGKPEPVSVEGIYTDVYLLDRPQATERFDPGRLPQDRVQIKGRGKRLNGLEVIHRSDNQRLVILGKPGAGKTTFLKHIALRAADGKLDDRVPILVYLREWTGGELMEFLTRLSSNGGITDPRAFIEHLLNTERALLLLDGLDEVNEPQRRDLIQSIEEFHRRYGDCRILLTCRAAATPHQFEGFSEIEVADFTEEQMLTFARNWFGEDTTKAVAFQKAIKQDKHLRDLGRTPLLLGMLCLTFNEQGTFLQKRTDLYQRGLDALLVKWDESRSIEREAVRRAEIYHNLSLGRKHQMFAYIAHETFEQGEMLISQKRLERLIADYLVVTPYAPARIDIDAGAVIKAIEAQHGILVEYAQRVYTFAHPTFQEYYSAHYIVEQAGCGDAGAIPRLLGHAHEEHWREVILLTASMLDKAKCFFYEYLDALDTMVRDYAVLVDFLTWAQRRVERADTVYKTAATRAYYVYLTLYSIYNLTRAVDLIYVIDPNLAHILNQAFVIDPNRDFEPILELDLAPDLDTALALDYTLVSALNLARNFDFALTLPDLVHDLNHALIRSQSRTLASASAINFNHAITQALVYAQKLEHDALSAVLNILFLSTEDAPWEIWRAVADDLRTTMIKYQNIGHDWKFTKEQVRVLEHYLATTELLGECLNVANISDTDRAAIEDLLLLPPKQETDTTAEQGGGLGPQ